MNVLMLMAVLFFPVLLIIFLAVYTQKKARQKKQELLQIYLKENYTYLRDQASRQYWLDHQLLVLYPDAAIMLLLKHVGPFADAATIPLQVLEQIEFFRQTASLKAEGASNKADQVVMRMGLVFHYNNRSEELEFFNYTTDQTSLLSEKEQQANKIRQEILELKNNQKKADESPAPVNY